METESTAPRVGRPRPILLVVLGIAVVALALVKLMPAGSARQAPLASNQPRPGPSLPGTNERVNPEDLDVRLDVLTAPRPEPSDTRRNPFRFEEPAPPPPQPPTARSNGTVPQPPITEAPTEPLLAPIPLKFIGIIEGQGKKLAALSDCKFTYRGEEGEIIDGRYRLVKIGVESVVMEYLDGRGRTTIRLSGQDCVGR